MTLSSKAYDRLKWISLVLLPGLSGLYFGFGEVWHLPYVTQVVGSIAVIDTFLGLLIGKSSKTYRELSSDPVYMGELVAVQEVDGSLATLRVEPKDEIPIFQDGRLVTFMVKREQLK